MVATKDISIAGYAGERSRAGERVYFVIDAARAGLLCQAAKERYDLAGRSLFDGPLASMLDHVAPHLFAAPGASGFFAVWERQLGLSAGMMFGSTAGPDAMWNHVRSLFVATDAVGASYSFRFYDPRVLRVFLPTCSAAQAAEFFGPARWALVEGEGPGSIMLCTPGRSGVDMKGLGAAAREQRS